ncbi:hypothetical protein FS837_008582 [Tulasnella sp. UAMH 9824]|nr:hypothetical protein FS837_008582 [Tulasnella sp. UAMH 9824]
MEISTRSITEYPQDITSNSEDPIAVAYSSVPESLFSPSQGVDIATEKLMPDPSPFSAIYSYGPLTGSLGNSANAVNQGQKAQSAVPKYRASPSPARSPAAPRSTHGFLPAVSRFSKDSSRGRSAERYLPHLQHSDAKAKIGSLGGFPPWSLGQKHQPPSASNTFYRSPDSFSGRVARGPPSETDSTELGDTLPLSRMVPDPGQQDDHKSGQWDTRQQQARNPQRQQIDVMNGTISMPLLSLRDIGLFKHSPERDRNTTEKGFVSKTGQLVAVKSLSSNAAQNPQDSASNLSKLREWFKHCSSPKHPRIAKLLGCNFTDDNPKIISVWYTNGNIANFLKVTSPARRKPMASSMKNEGCIIVELMFHPYSSVK